MKALKIVILAGLLTAGTLSSPLLAKSNTGGTSSRSDYYADMRDSEDGLAPHAYKPLSAEKLEQFRIGAAASVASVKSVAK